MPGDAVVRGANVHAPVGGSFGSCGSCQVILNSNVLHATAWNCNAGDFAELVNVGEPVYGFYFPDDQTVRAV
jgi:hypothetical protein